MRKQTTKLDAALDELLAGKTPEEIAGPDGLLKQLTKRLVERAMGTELTHHLGYKKHAAEGRGSGNNRNGTSRKKIQGDFGVCGDRSPARPQWDFRSKADSQARAPLQRI